ncbi:hypothetical protein COV93_05480 [Candidatus Woesearchaeota archaeon CG11_big_fil_rev_8_21_14_0_20_43_8]|nr:MAG: hypothetical protein COV93_05480 [Candidatus Woesearchaeota archaeon CG11_big_fil_rev_8_21_14_0_20_43_8]
MKNRILQGFGIILIGALLVVCFVQGLVMQWQFGSTLDATGLYMASFALLIIFRKLWKDGGKR